MQILGGMVGITILTLSVPRLVAEFIRLPVVPIIERIEKGEEVSAEELDRAYESLVSSEQWHEKPSWVSARARLEIQHARRSQNVTDMLGWLERAESTVEKSLKLGPGDPYAWLRLAYLRHQLSTNPVVTKEALMMSIVLGPYERSIALQQAQLAIGLWPNLSPYEQEDVYKLIGFLDTFNRGALFELAKQNSQSHSILLQGVATNPERLDEFVQELTKIK